MFLVKNWGLHLDIIKQTLYNVGTLMDYILQVIEDDPKYWEVMSSALAIGWLEIVVSSFWVLLR